ncbi:MAG TPA: glycosyltransferase, partial [Pirellulales bacterium]
TFATYYKGQDLLLKAMAIAVGKGCDVHCDFIGEGKHRPEIEQLAAQLGLKNRTIFHGQFSSGKAVYDFLDKADLLVMSSRGEGLPRSVIEALARGLPSIGTNVGGIPELLPPEDLFPLNDPPQMAAKIMEVVGNPARLAAMSARGLKIAADYLEPKLRERRVMLYRNLREITETWQRRHGIGQRTTNREPAQAK